MPLATEAATVAACDEVGPSLFLLHLDAPAIAAASRPGQFLLVRCTDSDFPTADPYLPRAYFVFAADASAGRLSVLVERRGRGSAWLASRRAGDRILALGPTGREVRPAKLTRHLLLLADGAASSDIGQSASGAVAGLAWAAAEAARRGLSVTLVENVGPGRAATPATLLSPDVEYRRTSPEAGGLLGALPPLLRWADEVVVAAALETLDHLAALRRSRHEPFTLHAGVLVQALPLAWLGTGRDAGAAGGDFLPCGAGWCGACVVATRRGRRLFCREGPVFPLEDLRFADPWFEQALDASAAADDGASGLANEA